MRVWRRGFFENPLIGRQLATHLTGGRLAGVFAFITGVLLLADVITFTNVLLDQRASFAPEAAGSLLWTVNSFVLLGLLILTLPLRLAGAIDGPRGDRVLDQVVVTGVSPLRIHAGNWAMAILYTLGVLAISLPFQVYAFMLGGVSWEQLAGGYLVLAIYANVIIAVALGLGVMEREWATAFFTVVVFAVIGIISVLPLPSEIALASPVRYFLQPLVGPRFLAAWSNEPAFYLWRLPKPAYAALVWTLMAIPPFLLVLLGPAHRFQPGLNNFGNVVLPGDRRRRFFRKNRLLLTRRVELAFFYENRPRWLAGVDYPLRALWVAGAVLILFGVIIGVSFPNGLGIRDSLRFADDPNWVMPMVLTGTTLGLAVLAFSDARTRCRWQEQVGRWKLRRGLAQGALAAALIGAYVVLHLHMASVAISGYAPSAASPADWSDRLSLFARDHRELVLAVAIFAANGFLLGRVLAVFVNAQVGLRLLLILAGGTLLIGPFVLAVGIEERWISRDWSPLLFWTPLSVFLARLENRGGFHRLVGNPDEGFELFLRWHGWLAAALLLALALAAAVRVWQSRRRSRAPASAPGAAALLLALVASAFAPRALTGQTSGPPLEAGLVYGFDGRLFQQGYYSPGDFFTLTIRSKAAVELRGTLRRERADGSVAWSRPLLIPPGTTLPVRWVDDSEDRIVGGMAESDVVIDVGGASTRITVPAPEYRQRDSRDAARFFLHVSESPPAPGGLPGGASQAGAAASGGQPQAKMWVSASAFCLPEEARVYALIDGVLLDRPDLSRWTAGQRRALLDYLRLGGTVVVSGALDPGRLKGVEGWETLLRSRRSYRATAGGVELAVEELEESRAAMTVPGAGGEREAVPILSERVVGLGRLCHLSLDAAGARLEPGAWVELWDRVMPRGDFPEGAFQPPATDEDLRDSSSLLIVLGYFAAYSCGIGPLGFLALRRRSRRRWLPWWILGLPAAFVALLPVLHASLHLRASYAALTRVAVYGAGARRGVAYACLSVQSSGRQDHSVAVKGASCASYVLSDGMTQRGRTSRQSFPGEVLLESSPPGPDPLSPVRVRTPPWGAAARLFVGDVRRDEVIDGRARLHRGTTTVKIEIAGAARLATPDIGFVVVRQVGSQKAARAMPLDLAGLRRWGVANLNYGKDSALNRIERGAAGGVVDLGQALLAGLPERDAVYIGWESDDIGLGIESTDLAFEREVESLAGVRVKASFRRSYILVELPVEQE